MGCLEFVVNLVDSLAAEERREMARITFPLMTNNLRFQEALAGMDLGEAFCGFGSDLLDQKEVSEEDELRAMAAFEIAEKSLDKSLSILNDLGKRDPRRRVRMAARRVRREVRGLKTTALFSAAALAKDLIGDES